MAFYIAAEQFALIVNIIPATLTARVECFTVWVAARLMHDPIVAVD
jgi:hypothetical protein